MNVILAKTAGFCFGVDKAVNTVYEEIKNNDGTVYTYGPIIHNEIVVSELTRLGVRVINSKEELDNIKTGTVIIRSHGVSRDVRKSLDREGIKVVDATCPFVAKIHRIVEKYSSEGYKVIIAGNREHPEVTGIKGWVNGECFIIDSAEELNNIVIEEGERAVLVAQTTYNYQKFKEFVEILRKMNYSIEVCNTVCSATEERQSEALSIAQKVDAMIVIGDKHSSNSRKLYDICRSECKRTYFIETIVDLEPQPFQLFSDVGITAGASTPKKLIEEVQNYVRSKF
ncbi:MAG: 4-hydroxy-3-methylbut-2-enyl diphosphate reductase [Candidatus Alectryocaccobium sp.]|nr:4-hydroxy-3-methylbut-2-enyl diphosphate reductase [Candidatus Alectryocaccobium sp.]